MTRIAPAMIFLPAMLLAACTHNQLPPTITYDSDSLKPAKMLPEPPKPVRIVTIPQPLPLPGQLVPIPSAETPDKHTPAERIATATRAATQEPTASGFINAMQVFPYVEGALYHLYAAPEMVSDITLQPGEQLSAISAGDIVRWVIGNTTSGSGAGRQVHVIVKPTAPGLHTDMVIATDRRTYHLKLDSTTSTSMAAVSWTYPQDQLFALQVQNRQAEAAAPVAHGLDLDHLHFRYAITGDNPPWRPVRAFDDGNKVYIEFRGRLDQGESPPLFVVGPKGDSELVNYRVSGNHYIVDQLFAAAELRLGADPQQVVRISRTDGVERAP
jgi:type IV secretion system protein VirB9